MKILYKIQSIICISLLLLWFTGCDKNVTDFGFNGEISGKVVDQTGNIVAGDITSNNLAVKALGEGDQVTMDMRVQGDGTYQNTKLFPKKFKVWVSGPVTMTEDTLRVNFSSNSTLQHDFVVIPFLTVKTPVLVGSPTSSEITVSYEITGNNGNVANRMEIYCSTVPYPNASTGSGPQYDTKTVTLSNGSGNATITGLATGTKYYIRIGARAAGTTSFNYSEQIVATTP